MERVRVGGLAADSELLGVGGDDYGNLTVSYN